MAAEIPALQPLSFPLHIHCRCKALSATVLTAPAFGSGINCHCTRCQRRFAAPFFAFAVFPSSSVQWNNTTKKISGTETLVPDTFKLIPDWDTSADAPKTNGNGVFDCTRCGGRMGYYMGTTNSFCVAIGAFEREGENGDGKVKGLEVIKPGFHIFYESRLEDVNDGLKKWETTPGA